MIGRSRRAAIGCLVLSLIAWIFVPRISMSVEPQRLGSDRFSHQRLRMVEEQIRKRGVRHQGVLRVMEEVPRHLFVPEALQDRAYLDSPQQIGDGQTISQPYIVALMTELLDLDGDEKVLEIGTGSGYQAAVLSQLAAEVYTIEIRDSLARQAKKTSCTVPKAQPKPMTRSCRSAPGPPCRMLGKSGWVMPW